MNWLCIRLASDSAWVCLSMMAPRTSATTSSSRVELGSASTGNPRRSASASTSAGISPATLPAPTSER
jgi:hypothetical protein